MGIYLNTGSVEFKKMLNSQIYVDKTNIFLILNRLVNTEQSCICVSRPRRFGKSVTANMIAAYYGKNVDSYNLFCDKKIALSDGWDKELNRYNVIHLDVADILASVESAEEAVDFLKLSLAKDLVNAFNLDTTTSDVAELLGQIYDRTGEQFVVIIDEWDALYRDDRLNVLAQDKYINFLRSLFKGIRAKRAIALAYLTGILPIKKYNSESALNNFIEFTMVSPKQLAPYIGFTEDEVKQLCDKYNMDYDRMQYWYDGYSFNNVPHIYSPNSVVQALLSNSFENFWSQTVAFNSLSKYITMNFDGLRDDIINMLGGARVKVDTFSFQNDTVNFNCKDDVLTVLIHLGYLGYDEMTGEVYIPNYEIRQIFEKNIRYAGWDSVAEAIDSSDRLLDATLYGNSDAVASALEEVHAQNTSILKYNDENSLACVVTLGYYSAKKYYKFFREFHSGVGFVDFVFVPMKWTDKPPIIIELKYGKSAEEAIKQIKERGYTSAFNNYPEVILVGINYDKDDINKKHTCIIEKWHPDKKTLDNSNESEFAVIGMDSFTNIDKV